MLSVSRQSSARRQAAPSLPPPLGPGIQRDFRTTGRPRPEERQAGSIGAGCIRSGAGMPAFALGERRLWRGALALVP
jgi:hypothetical protein